MREVHDTVDVAWVVGRVVVVHALGHVSGHASDESVGVGVVYNGCRHVGWRGFHYWFTCLLVERVVGG